MSDKCYPAAQALIDRAMKVDPGLAADIRAFAKSREYGLVFEHNRPEAMRLYGKPVAVGDAVHVLAERGQMETVDNHVVWHVTALRSGLVDLADDDGNIKTGLSRDDVVVVAEYDQPIFAGLRETGRVERGSGTLGDPGDKPYHVVINGENYHALQALQFCFAGKIDCIYIDPPYNTGAKDWKYNNDYVDGNDAYRHSKWLAWMERRLRLAKTLLNPNDSILVVAIDDNEYLRVGLLLEQIYTGAEVQMISTVTNRKGVSRAGGKGADSDSITRFSRVSEYLFFVRIGKASYVRTECNMLDSQYSGTAAAKSVQNVQWLSMLRRGSASRRQDKPKHFYPILVDPTTETIVGVGQPLDEGADRNTFIAPSGTIAVWPLRTNGDEGRWQLKKESFELALQNGTARLGRKNKEGRWAINYLNKGLLNEIKEGYIEVLGRDDKGALILRRVSSKLVAPKTVWNQTSHNASENGTTLLSTILGEKRFDYPKSLYAVEDTLRVCTGNKRDAVVLDFFAGSGSTAHAVMRLNHQDGGHRICISVTNNEISVEEEKRLTADGSRKGDPSWESLGICNYVTKPRIKAAITGMRPDGMPIGYGDKTTPTYLSDRSVTKIGNRSISMIDYLDMQVMHYSGDDTKELKKSLKAKKDILALLTDGKIAKKAIDDNPDFAFAENSEVAVLFNDTKADDFLAALDGQGQVRTVYVVTDDNKLFKHIKKDFQELLGPYEETIPEPFPMSKGFDENAIFFDLTYEEPDLVELGGAFGHVAPLLWTKAGCRGRIIKVETETYDVADIYAVLFDYSYLNELAGKIKEEKNVKTVFVVTDDDRRYAKAVQVLPDRDVVRLYESYLRSFRIAAEGAIS